MQGLSLWLSDTTLDVRCVRAANALVSGETVYLPRLVRVVDVCITHKFVLIVGSYFKVFAISCLKKTPILAQYQV